MTETLTRTIGARILTRADTPEAGTRTGYELSGIAVPFGEEYNAYWFTESFDRACEFEGMESAKLYWQHREVIGKITAHEPTNAGLRIDAKISETPLGDQAATLVRDEVIDSFSIGFEGLDYRLETLEDGSERIVWTRVRIREVSLVSFPAYESATLTEIRSRKDTPAMPTPTPAAPMLTREDLAPDFEDLREQIRSTQASIATLGDQQRDQAAPRFRSFGEFVRAYHQGDSEARAMQQAYSEAAAGHALHDQRAYDGSVLADTIARDPWVGDATRLIDKGRKVLNSFKSAPLPAEGNRLEYGVLASNTVQVTKQANEGDLLAKGKVTVDSESATVGTYGGWSELSFQAVERSSISLLDLTRRAQLIAYAQQTEAEVRALLTTTIGDNITNDHKLDLGLTATAADWISLMIDAHDAYEDAALPIDGLFLSKDRFKALATLADANDRLQFQVFGTGANSVGNLQVQGLQADLASVTVRLLPGAAANTGAFYNSEAITTWENAGAPLSLEDSNITNLTRSYSVYGYLACAAEIPDAILPIAFA